MLTNKRLLAVALLCFAGFALADQPKKANSLRLGLMATLFRDISDANVKTSVDQFKTMMEKETGLKGETVNIDTFTDLSDVLAKGEQDLGVFHGYEYAWAREKNPKLRPLAVAVNQQVTPHVHLLVPKNSQAKSLADLKGKKLGMPQQSKGYCWLYLDRSCEKQGSDTKAFFGGIDSPENIEDTIDDLIDGKVDAVVVDSVGFDRYKSRKPKRAEQVKTLDKSVAFPSVVIAYQEGKLDDAKQKKVLNGLLNATKHAEGKQMLTVWKLSGFERVPKDYDKTADEILKAYPAPK